VFRKKAAGSYASATGGRGGGEEKLEKGLERTAGHLKKGDSGRRRA